FRRQRSSWSVRSMILISRLAREPRRCWTKAFVSWSKRPPEEPEVAVNPNILLTNTAHVPLDACELPPDPALPGLALLCQPSQLTATLSRVLARWIGPDAQLLDSRAYLRRLSPGKRCSVELELAVGRESGVPAERRRLLGKIYREDQGATVYQTLRELRRQGLGAGCFIVPQPL